MEITSFPNDILTTIFKLSHPPIDLLYKEIPSYQGDNEITPSVKSAKNFLGQLETFKTIESTKKIAETLITLRNINKQFNIFFSCNINT